MKYLEHVHWVFGAFLIVGLWIAFTFLFLYLVRRALSKEKLKASHDVVGFAFGVIGVLYAVILGFTVVNVQERYNEAEKITQQEGMVLADLYRDSKMLPSPHADEIQRKIKGYIEYTLQEEWPNMQAGGVGVTVIENVRDLWLAYYKVEPKTESEKIWMTQSIQKLNDFTSIRLMRVYNSDEFLSPLLWGALYLGAVITIGFLGFFWMDNFKIHLVIAALLSGLIGFILYLIQALDTVYYGSISITPRALEQVQHVLNTWY